MLDKQKNLAAKFTQVNNKPPEAITQKDAAEMHSKQVFINISHFKDDVPN